MFPDVTSDGDAAATDETDGVIWLVDSNGQKCQTEAGAVVAGPNGGNIPLEKGGVVHRWANAAVNTDYAVAGQTVGGYVTPLLWANTGDSSAPADHIYVDGTDGTRYRWEVTYRPGNGGPEQTVIGEAQLDADTDYQGAGSTVTIDSVEVVLSSVLTTDTATGTSVALFDGLIGAYAPGGDLSGTIDAAVVGDDSHSHTASTLPDASTTVEGVAELATQAETDAGTDTTRIVTPATLASRPFSGDVTGDIDATVVGDDSHSHTAATLPDASTTVEGVVQLATQAETDAGTAGKVPTAAELAGFALSGDLSGTLAAPSVGNDSHSHTDATLPDATTTTKGVLETATAAETTTGTANDKAVTPSTVGDITVAGHVTGDLAATVVQSATTTQVGVLETATQAEVDAGTANDKIVTPDVLDGSALKTSVTTNTTDIAAETTARAAAIIAAAPLVPVGTYVNSGATPNGVGGFVRYNWEIEPMVADANRAVWLWVVGGILGGASKRSVIDYKVIAQVTSSGMGNFKESDLSEADATGNHAVGVYVSSANYLTVYCEGHTNQPRLEVFAMSHTYSSSPTLVIGDATFTSTNPGVEV